MGIITGTLTIELAWNKQKTRSFMHVHYEHKNNK